MIVVLERGDPHQWARLASAIAQATGDMQVRTLTSGWMTFVTGKCTNSTIFRVALLHLGKYVHPNA